MTYKKLKQTALTIVGKGALTLYPLCLDLSGSMTGGRNMKEKVNLFGPNW